MFVREGVGKDGYTIDLQEEYVSRCSCVVARQATTQEHLYVNRLTRMMTWAHQP